MREQQIHDIVLKELERAKQLKEHHYWVIPYSGFKLIKAKTYYGKTTHNGEIQISRIFLGTREFEQLKDTIRHEIAHLMCGLQNKHNINWQHIARLLGCKPRANQPMQGELNRTARKKWRLMGTLENGTEIAFQSSHVRQAKFLKPNRNLTCPHGKIISCRYVRNK